MPEIPRTKFNSPWTVAVIEAALNDVSSAKGSSESLTAALNAMRAEINSLSGGVHLKGAVDYYSDLPDSPSEGDAYTVRYQGTSGTDPLGIEYAWATYQGTPQWIPIGVDPSVFAKQTEMNVVANAGAKNLINYTKIGTSVTSGTSYTHQGVTFTLLSDGTVSATRNSAGTDTSFCNLRLDTTAFYIDDYCDGNHVLSGCPSDADINGYDIRATNNTYNAIDTGQGVVLSDRGSQSSIWIQIRISKNYSPDNLIFKPMIRSAAITDPTFQPYARTNRELTVLTDEDRASLVELVDGGAKSLLNPEDTVSDKSLRGVTVTRTGGVYSFSGTAEDNSNIFININNDTTINNFPAGDYVAIFEQPQNDIKLQVGINGTITYAGEFGEPLFFTIPSTATSNWIRFFFTRLVNYTGRTGRIMICTEAAWKISQAYQPYRPSWQEMYDSNKIIDISSQITAESGYRVESTTHLYYQNKQVFGTIAIAINSGSYSSYLTSIAKLPVEYAPARQYLVSCAFSTDQWAITDIGYAFLQSANASSQAQRGQISVKSPTANLTHMILNVCYPVQIDGTF